MSKEQKEEITMEDFGSPEYLDGILMQFCVRMGVWPLAYFGRKEDAELFAKAKRESQEHEA